MSAVNAPTMSAARSLLAGQLRRPGAILLVSCYELGHQPHGLAVPLAFLERAGYAPATLDLAVERLDPLKVARARLVAIAVPMHTALRIGVHVAARIRELIPHCYLVLYGLYATLNAEYLLERGADAVIGGEIEGPLLDLVEALEEGRPGPTPGVYERGRPAGPWLRRLAFPVPSRDALPTLDRYARLEYRGERRVVGYVEASRGCRHLCAHCPIPPVYHGRLFVVPKAVVLEDIERQVRAGARHITFGDPDFMNGPGHSLAIVRAMREQFPGLTFDCTVKVAHLLRHRAILPDLRACGCLFIVSAVESLSDTVLANLDKGHTRADVFEVLRLMRGAGITLRPTWVPFTPWTTLEDYLEMLDFIEAEGLIDHVDPVQYAIRLLIPPGSVLLERPAIRPYLGALDQPSFSYGWSHPDPRMDLLHQRVTALVEEAAQRGEDPALTFVRLRDLAAQGGRRRPTFSAVAPRDRERAPRLTEPWFC